MLYLMSGVVMGLSAGLAPGPLLTLVIAETIRHGLRGGIHVACAPVLTDFPIIALTLLVLSRLSDSTVCLGAVSLFGALFLIYLGYETFTSTKVPQASGQENAQSLKRGIVTNFLNPHPYLFWMTVGSPLILKAYSISIWQAASFLGGFYIFLVGSKVALSFVTVSARHMLAGGAYRHCMRVLGVLLWVFSFMLARDGLRFLGLIP